MCLVLIFLDLVESTSKTKLVVSEVGRLLWHLVLVCDGVWDLWGSFLLLFLNCYSFDNVVFYVPSLRCSNLFGYSRDSWVVWKNLTCSIKYLRLSDLLFSQILHIQIWFFSRVSLWSFWQYSEPSFIHLVHYFWQWCLLIFGLDGCLVLGMSLDNKLNNQTLVELRQPLLGLVLLTHSEISKFHLQIFCGSFLKDIL